MLRLLEELPDTRSGLSRSERTILQLIGHGVKTPSELFAAVSRCEEAVFMGDWSFYRTLDSLAGESRELIAGLNGLKYSPGMPEDARQAYLVRELSFTHLGYSACEGAADTLPHRLVERDIGGYHLSPLAPWRWDHASRKLIPPLEKPN